MIYQLLIRLLSPLILLMTLIDAVKRQGGFHYLQQRFGFGYAASQSNTAPIWIHCASVGEVKAVEALAKSIKDQHRLLITTNTPTGARLAEQLFSQSVLHAYLPLDYPFAIRRFLNHHRPQALWVVETEIWPNLYRLADQTGLPIALINARLSRKTRNSPKWLKTQYREALGRVDTLLARSQDEANRFLAMGADANRLQIIGNLKYVGLTHQPEFARPCSRDYVLLASSHANEEAEISALWLSMQRPELLVIVPRHPQRSAQIQKQLQTLTPDLCVHSNQDTLSDKTQIYLNDQIGVLMPWFAHAKVVIMGGAFVPKGGHNLMEAAALKAAIITGPDMSDFEDETQSLLDRQAVIQLPNLSELRNALTDLLNHPQKRIEMGQAAYQVVAQNQHLLANYQTALLATLKSQ